MTSSVAAFLLVLFVAICSARMAYELPDGADTILESGLQTSFSCDGRPYGYYADVANGCQVFHICLPIEDESGNTFEPAHFSFICGNQTLFSQDSLTCTYATEAFPCDQAESLYDSSNADFGKIEENLLK